MGHLHGFEDEQCGDEETQGEVRGLVRRGVVELQRRVRDEGHVEQVRHVHGGQEEVEDVEDESEPRRSP